MAYVLIAMFAVDAEKDLDELWLKVLMWEENF
jgi:hypothetical protein